MLKLNDFVQPKPEWIGDPNNVPTGRVHALMMSGHAAYVGDDPRAFATYVFDVVDNPTEAELAKPAQEETAKPAHLDLFAHIEEQG